MAKPGRPVRQDLTEARRARILDAACGVFTEKGYHRSTTKAIAAAAGVSEGAIYYHFVGKKDLLIGVLDRLLGNTQLSTDQSIPDTDFRTFYSTTVQARIGRAQPWVTTLFSLMSDVLTDPELAQHLYKTNLAPLIRRSENMLKAFVARGDVRDVNVPVMARLSVVLGLGVDLLYLMGDEVIRTELESPSDKLAQAISTLVLDGIASR